ncbi:MAG: response regulator transcription factor [Cyanobacteria bacterium J06600_6]
MTRILIVDDLNSIREFLKINLSSEPDIEVVALADNGKAAIAQTEEHKPDIILMDINMPGAFDGIEATAQIVQRFPETKVLLLTSQDDRQQLDKALKAGSRGYILKNTSIKDIANIIRLAEKGFFQIGPILGRWDGSFHNSVQSAETKLEIAAGASNEEAIIPLPRNFSYSLPVNQTTEMRNTISNLSSKMFQLQETVRSQANTITDLSHQYSQVQQEKNSQLYSKRSPSSKKSKRFNIYGGSPAQKSRSQKQQHLLFISSFFLGVVTVLLLVLLIAIIGSI